MLLRPTRWRTWVPAGSTPILSYHYMQDRISTWLPSPRRPSAGTWACTAGSRRRTARLWMCRTSGGPSCDKLRGHVGRLWDRGSIHTGSAIGEVCPAHPRLHGEEFPAFNPTEQLRNDFKSRTATGLLLATRALCRRLRDHTRRASRTGYTALIHLEKQ